MLIEKNQADSDEKKNNCIYYFKYIKKKVQNISKYFRRQNNLYIFISNEHDFFENLRRRQQNHTTMYMNQNIYVDFPARHK